MPLLIAKKFESGLKAKFPEYFLLFEKVNPIYKFFSLNFNNNLI